MIVKKADLKKQVAYYVSLPYTTTIEKMTDSGVDYYVARVIDLPGLIMTGDTPEEALAEMEDEKPEFIELCLQLGNEVPEPLRTRKYSGKIVLRLPTSVHEDLARIAALEGVSMNQYMVLALAKQIGRDEELLKENKPSYKASKRQKK